MSRYHPEEDMDMAYFRLTYRCRRDPASLPEGDRVSIIQEETSLVNAIITARRERRDANAPLPVDWFAPCSDCTYERGERVEA